MKTSDANINSCIGMDGILKQMRHEEFTFRTIEEKVWQHHSELGELQPSLIGTTFAVKVMEI